MNRAIAKRTLFEDREDYRFFESLIAREVRRGLIKVHSFSLMPTHFHLLVESPLGKLAEALANIEREYARWFNRRRRRDGPLFRGRFRSKPAGSLAYRSILVRYLDDNPVVPGLVAHAAAYPYGSARCYARDRGPPWLERSWVEAEVIEATGWVKYEPRDYAVRFPSRLAPSLRSWVEEHLRRSNARENEFASLLHRPEGQALRWMIRKALLADGMEPWVLPLPAELVLEELARWEGEQSGVDGSVRYLARNALPCLRAGLLRHGCALSLRAVRARVDMPCSTIHDRALRHLELMASDVRYARSAQAVLDRVQIAIQREAFPHRMPSAVSA